MVARVKPSFHKLNTCRSHYWVRGGNVRWAGAWSQEEIDAGRARDRWTKQKYFGTEVPAPPAAQPEQKESLWRRLKWW
jgi:Family of unknown function (DUF6527)